MREARRRVRGLRGWSLRGKTLVKTYHFPTYRQAVRFFNKVASLAERLNHHPDAYVGYGKVVLRLTTHDLGGLTMKDFNTAALINKLEKRYAGKAEGKKSKKE